MNKIKQLMLAKGITQKQLAEAAGVTEASISRYVRGTRTPTLKTAEKLSHVLGFPIIPSTWHTDSPKTNKLVLCWYEFYSYYTNAMMKTYGIGFYENARWRGDFTNKNCSRVLAWTELPEAPEEV